MPPLALRLNNCADPDLAPAGSPVAPHCPASSTTFADIPSSISLTTPPSTVPPKRALHESATADQIAAAPTGTLTHRHYVCPSLLKERPRHNPPRLVDRAVNMAEGNLMLERALAKSIADPPTRQA